MFFVGFVKFPRTVVVQKVPKNENPKNTQKNVQIYERLIMRLSKTDEKL